MSPARIVAAACGAVAQLGERDVRNVEVRGSIPLCSTNLPEINDLEPAAAPARWLISGRRRASVRSRGAARAMTLCYGARRVISGGQACAWLGKGAVAPCAARGDGHSRSG